MRFKCVAIKWPLNGDGFDGVSAPKLLWYALCIYYENRSKIAIAI